jgi:RNA polymerase sigma-70 factor (ECF subfamily)
MGVTALDLTALTDDELIARCLAHDEAAVRVVTGRYNQRLYRITRSILGDGTEAEDAVQDAYLRAFSGLERFRGDAAFATWLTRIAINEALARVRRRQPTVEWAPASEAALHPHTHYRSPSASANPETTMRHREIQDLLERSIDMLPEPFRVVFVARFVEGLDVNETAALFGLRPETVKTRTHRARQRLRAHLQQALGSSISEVFRFDGARCDRMTDAVIRRLREPLGAPHI